MQMDINGTISKAVADYTGATVLELEVVPAPEPGVFAVQALVKPFRQNAFQVQFLLEPESLNNISPWTDLEEVEFTSWPPVARSLHA